mmetsp:Transcript_40400/g.84852  ORF Transcript_40400/g.84852 Transcript_40400/m.84852 type:complete len:108 (+) Transcript_40400:754-1077(+)|eukprot:CAMPEP_0183719970 /NCGR_PEP_ID=MMETSP0737-20130205/12725_1 /TAXON_ID=385413 /ORGANISM="Thalassiosira miniscula, Strain CCMP1093" /LENGTH=107 /DNA_ID=CAMNT_0025949763 /DNA_START=736 /DNA_END=1059 /DNA_ORIENTATION=-
MMQAAIRGNCRTVWDMIWRMNAAMPPAKDVTLTFVDDASHCCSLKDDLINDSASFNDRNNRGDTILIIDKSEDVLAAASIDSSVDTNADLLLHGYEKPLKSKKRTTE